MTATLTRIASTREAWRTAATAIYRAGEALIDAGKPVQASVTEWEDDLTARQRGFLHAAVFPQIAEQVNANGDRFTAEVWKEFYRKKFLGSRWRMQKLPGQKRAVPVKERVSTESLGIKAYSEYIDRVISDAVTEWGVAFRFLADEREAVRYRPPARAKRRETEGEPA